MAALVVSCLAVPLSFFPVVSIKIDSDEGDVRRVRHEADGRDAAEYVAVKWKRYSTIDVVLKYGEDRASIVACGVVYV